MSEETKDRLFGQSSKIFGTATRFAVAAEFTLVFAALEKTHGF